MADRRGRKPPKKGGDQERRFPGPDWSDSRQRWSFIGWALLVVVVIFSLQSLLSPGSQTIPFSRFLDLVQGQKVEQVTFSQGSASGTYTSSGGDQSFDTTIPPNYSTTKLVNQLKEQNVDISATQPNGLGTLFWIWIFPLVLLFGIYWLFMRRMRNQLGGGAGGPLSLGKNKAKLYDRADMKTTFADVAGVDEVETELVEIVEYLRNPGKFASIGARIPKGVLLVGPPGTGKTLLARAVAGEAGVPFFYISASEFIELFVGLGAARVRDLFQQARQRAPAIVFIDEIDSIGQTRSGAGGPMAGSHQEQEQTLQQLLTEMDGFEPNSGVIIVAASNRPDVLDPALLRPGRFDRQIQVNLPDIKGREEILRIHARDVKMGDGVDLKVLARRTPGFSGAQLANVINEGALLAAREGRQKVDMNDLDEAINRVVAGLERRSQVLSEKERRLVAYHELGHALVATFVENANPVHRISIVPRSIGALGYTQELMEEERYLMSEPELRDRLAVLLGGRSAEEIVFGFATTGAQDDLKRATDIARRMVMEFGMSERVGPINIADESNRFLQRMFSQSDPVSDETETIIDREVKSLLTGARDTAHRTIDEHRRDLDVLAEVLLERETLDRRDLDAYFSTGKIPLRVKEGRADGDGDGARPRRDRDAEPEQTEEVLRPATYDGEAERRTHELPSEERR